MHSTLTIPSDSRPFRSGLPGRVLALGLWAAGFWFARIDFSRVFCVYALLVAPEAGLPFSLLSGRTQNLWMISLSLVFIHVVRHAHAGNCRVRFDLMKGTCSPALEISITDDGVGLPEHLHSGLGLASIWERAEELGGRIALESGPDGGVRVWPQLPLPGESAA